MTQKKCCTNTLRLSIMMGLVFTYFLVELIVGHVTKSISLVADSFHMLSDFVGLIVGLSALRISKWPRGSKNTFGWQRAEVLGALVNTVILTTLCFTLIIEAIQRYITPEVIERPQLMLGVGGGGLFINLVGLAVLWNRGGHGHSHGAPPNVVMVELLNPAESEESDENVECPEDKAINNGQIAVCGDEARAAPLAESESIGLMNRGQDGDQNNQSNVPSSQIRKRTHSSAGGGGHRHSHGGRSKQGMNMKAVFLHVLSDALGSVIVMVSAAVFTYVPGDPEIDAKWKKYIDPTMTVVLVCIILFNTIPLLRQASLILLQSVPKDFSLNHLEDEIKAIEGIDTIHDLHVWQLQPNCMIGTVHLKCSDPENYIKVSQEVKTLFHERGIHCTTIQPEFKTENNDNCANPDGCNLTCDSVKECGKEKICCPTNNSSLRESPAKCGTGDEEQHQVVLINDDNDEQQALTSLPA